MGDPATDRRFCAGAIWRLPNGRCVQLVMLDFVDVTGHRHQLQWVLHSAGLAHSERDGKMFYLDEELPKRLAGAEFMGHDSGDWKWDRYCDWARVERMTP